MLGSLLAFVPVFKNSIYSFSSVEGVLCHYSSKPFNLQARTPSPKLHIISPLLLALTELYQSLTETPVGILLCQPYSTALVAYELACHSIS